MPRKIKIVKKVVKSSSKGKSFFSKRLLISLSLVVLLGLGVWGLIRSLTVPTDINLVASDVAIDDGGLYKPRIIDENGCYYQPVKCVKAPCDPIKVCNSTPLPTMLCAQEVGSCSGWGGQCIQYTDSCQKARFCGQPMEKCIAKPTPTSTAVPNPTSTPAACTRDAYLCPDGTKVGRTGPNCEFICPKPTSTPAPTCIPKPACLSESPVTCKIAVLGNWCEDKPQPVNVYLTTFAASDPCGISNYKSYQYSCSNGVKRSINDSCLSLSEGMKRAKESCQLQTIQKQ